MITVLPNKLKVVLTSFTTKPVTATAEVVVNKLSIIGTLLPVALDIGRANNIVPIDIITINEYNNIQ